MNGSRLLHGSSLIHLGGVCVVLPQLQALTTSELRLVPACLDQFCDVLWVYDSLFVCIWRSLDVGHLGNQ